MSARGGGPATTDAGITGAGTGVVADVRRQRAFGDFALAVIFVLFAAMMMVVRHWDLRTATWLLIPAIVFAGRGVIRLALARRG